MHGSSASVRAGARVRVSTAATPGERMRVAMQSSSALVRARVGVGPGLGPGPRSWSSLSCDAHSGIEPGAPQDDGLDMSHVSSSSSASTIPLRAMLAAPVSGSQVASQGSALSTTAGSLLTGTVLGAAPLVRLSSGAAPVAGLLARPLNAAAGTSMPMRQSRGIIDCMHEPGTRILSGTTSRSNHAIKLANFRGGTEAPTTHSENALRHRPLPRAVTFRRKGVPRAPKLRTDQR